MRKSHVRRAGVLLAGLALLGAACGSSSKSSTSSTAAGGGTTAAGGGTGAAVKCSGLKLGFFGALTGANGNLGVNIKKGEDLAVSLFNSAHPNCQVTVEPYDSQGDPKQAPALATKAVSDAKVVGIVGPAFSGESAAVNPTFEQAGLPTITPSATNSALSTNSWKFWHRALASDALQGAAQAAYITGTLKATKVGVIDDSSTYGKGLADVVRAKLGSAVAASDEITAGGSDFSAAVNKMKTANPDVIMFGGYYSDAGKLAQQLHDAGVTAKLIFGDGVLDKGYVTAGGTASEGSVITCACAPTSASPDFLAKYKAKFNEDPATYGPEAFDAANAFLDAIAAGKVARADINTFLSTYDKPGVTKQMKWDATGEVASSAVYAFQIKSGAIATLGVINAQGIAG